MLQIVAGLEPETTNHFLQMLGRAARSTYAAEIVQVNMVGCGQANSSCTLTHAAAMKEHRHFDVGICAKLTLKSHA